MPSQVRLQSALFACAFVLGPLVYVVIDALLMFTCCGSPGPSPEQVATSAGLASGTVAAHVVVASAFFAARAAVRGCLALALAGLYGLAAYRVLPDVSWDSADSPFDDLALFAALSPMVPGTAVMIGLAGWALLADRTPRYSEVPTGA